MLIGHRTEAHRVFSGWPLVSVSRYFDIRIDFPPQICYITVGDPGKVKINGAASLLPSVRKL